MYNAAITACGRSRQYRMAQGLYDEMALRGVRPNAVTLSALIAAYSAGGQWEAALAIFENAVRSPPPRDCNRKSTVAQ